MLFAFGFDDAYFRLGKGVKSGDFIRFGDYVLGSRSFFYEDADRISYSRSTVFEGTDLRRLVTDVNGYSLVDGMLSFINVDKRTCGVLVVGDSYGRLPLYYYYQHNLFGVRLLVSDRLSSFYGCSTVGVVKLGVAEYLHFDGKRLHVGKYSRTVVPELVGDSVPDRLATLLECSVESQLRVMHKPCLFLGGGIGSAAMAYAYKRVMDRWLLGDKLTAFTFSVGDTYDLDYSQSVCDSLGIELVRVVVTEQDVLDVLDKVVLLTESFDWNVVANAVAHYFLCKAAFERGFRTALRGDFARGLFVGYPDVSLVRWSGTQYLDMRDRVLGKLMDLTGLLSKVSDSFGIQVADPFSGKQFFNFIYGLGDSYKDGEVLGERVNRYLLRLAFSAVLPKEVVLRVPGWYGGSTFGCGFLVNYSAHIRSCYDESFSKDGVVQNTFV